MLYCKGLDRPSYRFADNVPKTQGGQETRNLEFSQAYGLLRRFRILLDNLVRKAY